MVDERTALARVIRSESGSYTEAERYAIGWVTRNRAAYKKVSIAKLVCSPTCGHGGGGRWASSAKNPEPNDFVTADRVLATSTANDPTHGAIDAFEPKLQDALVASGRPGYTSTAADVRKSWSRSMDLYAVVGHWELYGLKNHRTLPPYAGAPRTAPGGRWRVVLLAVGLTAATVAAARLTSPGPRRRFA